MSGDRQLSHVNMHFAVSGDRQLSHVNLEAAMQLSNVNLRFSVATFCGVWEQAAVTC